MLSRRFVCTPVSIMLAVTCAMGIMLLGGCPQQQIPSPAPAQEPNNTAATPTDTTNIQPERPIPGPVIDANTPSTPNQPTGGDTSNDTTSSGGGGNNGGGTGGGGTATFSVNFAAPLAPVAVRPGAKIDLGFRLTDAGHVVTDVKCVVARDDNQDQQPDGDPVAAIGITAVAGTTTYAFDTSTAPLNSAGFGRFLLGVRVTTSTGEVRTSYASGTVTIDNTPPTGEWISPTDNKLTSPGTWQLAVRTSDNSPHTVRVLLDNDTNPNNGYAGILVPDTVFPANDASHPSGAIRQLTAPLSVSSGTYYYYVIVSDGVEPPTAFYAPNLTQGGTKLAQLMVTNRLVGVFNLNRLDPSSTDPNAPYDNGSGKSKGAILQGFNYNDLAGSSMSGVPDLNGDGVGELLIASRFGKPFIINDAGIGFGEAYMLYGSTQRFRDITPLNAVGRGSVPGLLFPGIRCPVEANPGDPTSSTWTHGLSDVTVVPDMDGDDLPELVFSFPRVESVSLANSTPGIQHPELFPDYPGEGAFEYDASLPGDANEPYYWEPDKAQFTRGGIVIVSSHSPMLKNPQLLDRKGNRLVNLAEVGQMFDDTRAPRYFEFLWHGPSQSLNTDCGDPNDPNTPPKPQNYTDWGFEYDIAFENQGPGGFDNHFSAPQLFGIPVTDKTARAGVRWDPDPYEPPLANIRRFAETWPEDPNTGDPITLGDACTAPNCIFTQYWTRWDPFPVQNVDLTSSPNPLMFGTQSWHGSWSGKQSNKMIWTGFCGRGSARVIPAFGGDDCGARVLGQRREDRFGTTVGADGNWLYISAPERTALKGGDNVPSLEADRIASGVVYQLRTNAHPFNVPYTVTQLWMEPNVKVLLDPNDPNYPRDPNDPNTPVPLVPAQFPHIDAELPDRIDEAMPTPHQWIIETIGSTRGGDQYWPELARKDPPRMQPVTGERDAAYLVNYSYGRQGCAGAEVVFDNWTLGVPASTIDESPFWPHYGPEAAEYYVDRTPQIVGPHVFARISFVRGLRDVNGDGVPDFAVGSPQVQQDFSDPQHPTGPKVGAVFIVYGRQLGFEGDYLLDRVALAPSDPRRVRGVMLRGTNANDGLGAVFDSAQDFDGDGLDDVVVGASGASSGAGEAIVIFGSTTLQSPAGGWTIPDIVAAARGVRFIGEKPGDMAGANVAGAGDVDGDGYGDILIAAPGAAGGRGAVYLVYGTPNMRGQTLNLRDIGTFALPGVKFTGRAAGDYLGGGALTFPGDRTAVLNPDGDTVTVTSRGVVALGDIDGDGKADFALSSMLASPNGRANSGEAYVIYGRGN